MEKDKIINITIAHKGRGLKEQLYLTNFFEFAGFLVYGELYEKEKSDYVICINQENKKVGYYNILCGSSLELKKCKPKKDIKYFEKNWIKVILEQMKSYFNENTFSDLLKIARCYCKYDLMRTGYSIDHFSYIEEEKAIEYMNDSIKIFLRAYHELKQVCGNQPSKYMLAAISSCQLKAWQLYSKVWDAKYEAEIVKEDFSINTSYDSVDIYSFEEEIKKNITYMLELDKNFPFAYILKAQSKIFFDYDVFDSVFDFKKAVNILGKRPHASKYLLKIADHYIYYYKNFKLAEEYMQYAIEADPFNYKTLFKFAMRQGINKNEEKKVAILEKIILMLSSKDHLSEFLPLEYELLYKANWQIGWDIYKDYRKKDNLYKRYIMDKHLNVCMDETPEMYEAVTKREDYSPNLYKAATYMQEAEKWARIAEDINFYQWVYGNYGELFKLVWKKNIQLAKFFLDLKEIYSEIGYDEGLNRIRFLR